MSDYKKDKKVLVIGSGGREHAIVDAFSRSARVAQIYCAPGNAGIAAQATCVPIKVEDVKGLADFAEKEGIDLTFVGPEAALAAGVTDEFRSRGLEIFGPTKAATQVESSKEFAKQLMLRHKIPTGSYRPFDNFEEAVAYTRTLTPPIVVKYDGLAAGKGVVVAASHEETEEALRDMLVGGTFGHDKVIVEEFLSGPEFSLMCLVNGDKVYPLEPARDHKRAYDCDKGPNTGGMGAYCPVDFVTSEIRHRAIEEIMKPAAAGLAADGTPFCGVLYGGLILTEDGPKVIEFNARFGDPETEVILPRLESDFYTVVESVLAKKEIELKWNPSTALGIVVAAEGYPGKYTKGIEITIPDDLHGRVFHMGTAMKEGKLVSAGGRVMMDVVLAPSMAEARKECLEDTERIATPGFFFRHDIGAQSISGTAVAKKIKAGLRKESEKCLSEYGRVPHLTLVLVGENPDSVRYVGLKGKACDACGFTHTELRFPENVTEEELLKAIHRLNEDPGVDGMMVQLPLPAHIDEKTVLRSIAQEKDADALQAENVADLMESPDKRETALLPCTPKGVIRLLDEAGVEISGRRAVMVGRSSLVGFPLAKMLLDRDATVTICHSKTENLGDVTKEADILVVAAGQPRLIKADMVKSGAAVMDVGINYDPATGKLCGDTDFPEIRKKASVITPVPGGVGPMTVASLMENTMACFRNSMSRR